MDLIFGNDTAEEDGNIHIKLPYGLLTHEFIENYTMMIMLVTMLVIREIYEDK
jgi:hypothetical protein